MRRADREVTDVDGMIDIIDHCKVCHIALMDGEWPYIVAMNFVPPPSSCQCRRLWP